MKAISCSERLNLYRRISTIRAKSKSGMLPFYPAEALSAVMLRRLYQNGFH